MVTADAGTGHAPRPLMPDPCPLNLAVLRRWPVFVLPVPAEMVVSAVRERPGRVSTSPRSRIRPIAVALRGRVSLWPGPSRLCLDTRGVSPRMSRCRTLYSPPARPGALGFGVTVCLVFLNRRRTLGSFASTIGRCVPEAAFVWRVVGVGG